MVGKPKTKTIKRPNPNKEWKLVKVKYQLKKDWKIMTWRPTRKTPEVLQKLEEAYQYNCTDEEACAYAGIWVSTLQDWKKADEKFSEQIFQELLVKL